METLSALLNFVMEEFKGDLLYGTTVKCWRRLECGQQTQIDIS